MKSPATPAISVARRFVGRRDSVLARKSIRESLVSLAALIGCSVRDEEGREIGKLVDLVVRNEEATYPAISGLIVKVGSRKSFISGAGISAFTQNEIKLSTTKINIADFVRREGESLLDADVLDHQIVDVDGLRVVRTSDLYLAPLDKEIRIVGVDISFKTFFRRVLPRFLAAQAAPSQVIDWASVASLTTGGVVKTSDARSKLSQLRPADLADLIEDLAGREQGALISMLDPDIAADAMEEMEEDDLEGLLRGLSVEKAGELISRMEPDEAAEILRDLAYDHRDSIFAAMDSKTAGELKKLISYDEDSAGGIMTSHMLITRETDTVAHSLKLLVENKDRDITDGVLVVDSRGRLVDHIQIIELIAAKPTAPLSTLIGPPYPTAVNVKASIEEVVDEFADNRGSSIVVVDDKGKPVGRILADDLVDALTTENETRGVSQGSGALS
jgi:CBS domain-containing protein/sporulation protein YlmC with PRC-barrel domain